MKMIIHKNNFELLIEKAVDNFVNESINDFFLNDKKELNKSDLKEFLNYINEKLGKEKEYTMIEILQDKKRIYRKKRQKQTKYRILKKEEIKWKVKTKD